MKLASMQPSVKVAYHLQPCVLVAKDMFPFATLTDRSKKANFMGFSYEYSNLYSTFWKYTIYNLKLVLILLKSYM